jgi:hypothetical protein
MGSADQADAGQTVQRGVGGGALARQSRQMALKWPLGGALGGASIVIVNVLSGDLAQANP